MKNILSALVLLTYISHSLSAVTWVFPTNNANLTVSEDDNFGKVVATLNATAANALTFTDVSELPAGDIFGIQNTNELFLKGTLDYETTRTYSVVLRAIDNSDNEDADITVTIEVKDVNDEDPVITSPTTLTLLTNTPTGTVVYTVTSTDADTVGTVSYFISSGNDNGIFSINSTTGEITLNTALDIIDEQHDLVIGANDGVNTATQNVRFYLSNVFWQTPAEGQTNPVSEDTPLDTELITLNATNAIIYAFEVDPDSEKNKFQLAATTGILTLEQDLDYETIKSYIFTFTATGGQGTAERIYIINVTDVNDVPPEFATATVPLDLTKDTDIGTVVFTAVVTDEDTVGTQLFSITGGNTNSAFSINTTTGEVSLEQALDPDVTATYDLVIEVTDGVTTANMTLSITVNRIVWTDPVKGASEDIAEDTPVNKVIKNLTADTAISYTIQSQSPDTDTFDIVNTNELVLIKSLDYETVTDYIIRIRAIDSSGKVADIVYTLNVTDVNDVVPVFQSGQTVVVPENKQVGDPFFTVSAIDSDTVGAISYSINGGNDNGYFTINSTSGEISLLQPYKVNDTSDLTIGLSIQASDTVNNADQSLSITFKSVPVLSLGPQTITENVNTSGGYEVLSLASTDVDADINPEYSIVSQSHPGTFAINDDNTKLITTASFDREDIDEYNVTIRVTDTSQFKLSSDETVVVTISDENDVAPNVTSSSSIELSDDLVASNTEFVYTATADDPDLTGTVSFSITAGNTDNDFEMISNGSMYLNNTLDGSRTPSYTLTITATDTVNTTPFELSVRVITEPQVALPDANVTIVEGSYASQTVWPLNATDVDNDANPTFEIVSQEVPGTFALNGNKTEIITSATFDYETKTTFEIILRVTDSSTLQRSSTATLTVYVTDVNDEPPVFSVASVALNLREDTSLGYVDYNATTTDADSASATYTITGGNTNDAFLIDPDTGNLALAKALTDFPDLTYDLVVQANDSVNVATQQVNISVVTAPVFVFPGSVEIPEGSYAASERTVLVLNSTDRDGDINPAYEIVSQDPASTFILSADNSSLVTTASFDYEGTRSYNVTLKVTDTSTFAMTNSEILTILVTDVNDNAPVFTSSASFDLSEFAITGEVVFTANSTDVDTMSTVIYDIIGGNINDTFSINATSGEVTLSGSLKPDVTLTYDLILQANDTVLTSTINVTANVKTAPRFVFPDTNITIPENTNTSSSYKVWTITSNDADGDSGVQYDIVAQSVNDTFSISADNKDVITTESFDFETTQLYTVTLRATDNSTFSLSSTGILYVEITDVNDNVPVFSSPSSVDLPEFQENGTVVAQIVTTDADTVGTTTYSITDGNADGYFSLDSISGNLTLEKLFDPATILTYNLTIQANDTDNVVTTNFIVNVVTVPRIDPILINITENSRPGEFEVWVLAVSDLDNDTNPVFALEGQSNPGVFEINANKTAVVTSLTFDYESTKNFTFIINVTDSSSLKLSSSATFTVSIIDENDVAPNFTSSMETDVLEDAPISTSVYKAETYDPDTIGATSYSIIGGNDEGIFEINATSGEITLTKTLNASLALTYMLQIEANDTVNTATHNVTFKVRTAPKMNLPDMVTVEENVALGTAVLILNSTDLDGDGNPSYELVNQSTPGVFKISDDNTMLVTNSSIDFETDQNFTVAIRVTETSDLNLTSTSEFTIYVQDVNDRSPIFTSENSTELAENTPINETFYTAVAVDEDTTGTITFSLIDGDGVFAIDAESGNLTLQTILNPTKVDDLTYNVVIQASDSINTATLNLTIAVKTVPVIHTEDIYIPEDTDTSGGYLVWQINSTDLDGDENPVFKIVDDDGSRFEINPTNSTNITTSGITPMFDFETTKNYTIIMNVTDTSTFKLSSTATLTVFITDVNDNDPVFTSNTSIVVFETANTGEPLYVATAEDVDTVGNISYSIKDGNRNGDFAIDSSSGELTLQNQLNPQIVEDLVYYLVIEANDSVNAVTFNVTINVKTAPKLNITDQSIDENTDTSGTYELLNITWSDLDGDQNPNIEVVAESHPGSFQVKNDSVLVTNTSFDYESVTNLTVTLRITDVNGLTSNDTFTLFVNDINDNPPVFTSNSTVDISEDTQTGTIFYTAVTTDRDTNPTVEYSIVDGNAGNFSINSSTGAVTLEAAFDENSDLEYLVTLQANDSLNVRLFNLTINVITVPRLTAYQINVTENNDVPYAVWNLTSSDRDNDVDPVYVLINQSDAGVFVINDDNTAVVTNTSFDFEVETIFTFVIEVTDTSSLKLSSTATFTVSVGDANDLSPVFTSSDSIQLEEDTPPGTVIYETIAEDNDTVGSLSFDIIGGNDGGLFSIDSNNGNITLVAALNATVTLTHVLTLQANDTLNTAELNVTIALSTAPVLVIPNKVTVVENVAIGSDVMELNSTDLDGDTNPIYKIINQSEPNAFKLNDNNTKLVTNSSIDYETLKNYTVALQVTDTSSFTKSSSAEFTIIVVDANDESPVFTSNNSVDISQFTATGTVIYNVTSQDVDTIGSTTYSITGGNPDGVFAIDADAGSVTLETALNPTIVADVTFNLVIQANDSVNTAALNLTVNIKTAPKIHVEDIEIPENINTTNVYTVWPINSTDLDGDQNTTFAIVSQSHPGTFEINAENEIVTSVSFDYETIKNYTVVLNATDLYGLSSTATVTILVTDENDVTPTFTSNTSIIIFQTANSGDEVYTATSDDADTVGSVSYSVTDGNRNNDFAINSSSGVLTLENKLAPTVEADLVYNLVIEANDTVNIANLTLTINVKTVPYLNLTNVNIAENTVTSPGYDLQTLQWNDLDNDTAPTFDIVAESIPGVFQIQNGILITNASLDYESETSYNVTIRITDVNGLSSNDTFTLFVDDENDVTPVFENNITIINLWEQESTGEVYTLSATDPDTVGSIRYSIKGGNNEAKFSLGATNGTLTLEAKLDFATTQSYFIQMIANDSLNVASFNLTVNVKTSPVINFTGIDVEIPEDIPISSVVLNLTSADADNDPNPQYDIIDQDGTAFFIDGDQIKTNVTFDREEKDTYNVIIQVTDSVLGLRSADTLTVTVTDVNDNAPVIRYPTTTAIEVREDTEQNSFIFKTQAEDNDLVGNLSYTIQDGNTNNDFNIDETIGNVTLANTLNALQTIDYNLTVVVSDGLFTANVTVPITVKTAPRMDFPNENVTIAEDTDTSGNYTVITLASTDLDNDPNPRYEIVSQSKNGTFFISGDNQQLLTSATFNYTDINMYEVTIQVTDSSQFSMSSSATLIIYITDVNNLAPEFTSGNKIELPETQQTGITVYQAVAVDTDTVGQISYSITGGNSNGDFAIGEQSGNLTLVNVLEPSKSNILQYVLTIQANDTVNTASLELTIDVKTIPEIVIPDDAITIDETTNTSESFAVHELKFVDLDNDTNPTFVILSQSVNDTFVITNNTKITTTATFDYETRQTYEIVVQITDSSVFSLSSTATLTVSVVDADDEAPVFTSTNVTYVPETQAASSIVYNAITYDNDTTTGVIYTIEGGNTNNDFSIDPDSGALTLMNTLRPRELLEYNLQIQADDSTNQAILNLTVIVVTAPTLLFPADPIEIDENTDTSSGTFIWQAASSDLDGDTNPKYAIVSQSVNGTFEFNNDNTRLITKAEFDYEETTAYEVTISVTDTSPLQLSSTSTLTVKIVDLNDVTPNITSPDYVKILENTDTGKVIYTVIAEDPDTVGNVTYSIIGGNTNNDFIIDSVSGNITLVNTLNATLVANYSLQIQASDTLNVVNFTLLVELKPDIDECASNPCKNNATCVDGIDEFKCDCLPGYTSDTCDTEIDECEPNPCENNATCTDLFNDYNCTCIDGFEGRNCSIDIDECASSPCQNGTCNDLVNGYNCSCVPGYTGDNCETDIDECSSSPCGNGGMCTDGINGYVCTCVPGYDGDRCENDIDECAAVTCSNNGTCNDLINGYNCTCPSGFTGTLCGTDIDECASNPCQNSITCVNKVNGYQCVCKPGYTGTNCETDIDECASNPCKNGGNCTDGINEFTCDCAAGYRGPTCNNKCSNNTFGRNCNQNCACNINGIISCDNVNGTCICNNFYQGNTCNDDIDECTNTSICSKPNEGCDNIRGGYACSCKRGYKRNNITDNCDAVTTTTTTTQIPSTQVATRVSVKFDITIGDSVDLTVQATYIRYEIEIKNQLTVKYTAKLQTSAFTIIIRSIVKGSIDVTYDVITSKEDAPKVAEANADIATDNVGITIFNETALPSEMTINDVTVPVNVQYTDAVACQIFEATSGRCTGDFICDVKDGSPVCVRKDDDDNLNLILGLGIGIPAFFVAVAVVVLCIAFYNNKSKLLRRKYRGDDYDESSNEMYDRKLPVRANTGPPTWPFVASPEYVEYGPYSDYSREGGQRYLPSEDFHGQYDNQVARDGESNNYTWDYLFTQLRPGEPYQIRRPKVDYK